MSFPHALPMPAVPDVPVAPANPSAPESATPKTRSGRVRLEAFDTLRLLCALHIMAFHLLERPLMLRGWPDWLVVPLASSAGLSTSIFFLLSGFVVAYSHSGDKPFNPLRPMGRSYPLFLLVMVTWTLSLESFDAPDWKNIGSSLLLMNPLMGKFPADPCVPAWAMTTFYLGYLMNALMLPGLSRLSARRLRGWLVVLLIALTLRGVACALYAHGTPAFPEHENTPLTDYLHIFPMLRVPDILCGTLCGLSVSKGPASEANPVPARHRRWELTLVALWLLCSGLCMTTGAIAFGATHGLLAGLLALWLLRSPDSVGGALHRLGPWIRRHLNISLEMYVFHTFVAALVYRVAIRKFGAETPDVEMKWTLLAFALVAPTALVMTRLMNEARKAMDAILARARPMP